MRIGIVGAGAVVRRGHLPSLMADSSLEIVSIADQNELLARDVAEEFSIPKYYKSYDDLLKDDSLDIIDICTPSQSHLEVIEAAARRHKHVLVEKPMAISLKDAIEIVKIVKSSGIKLSVVQNYRYFPSVLKAKNRIDQGYLGKIVSMRGLGSTHFPSSWTRNLWLYHEGGAFFDFGPHVIDLILWLNNSPVKKVVAFGGDISNGEMGFLNYGQILLKFENGTVATIDLSWLTGIFKFAVDIFGTTGHALLDVRNDNFGEYHGSLTPFDDTRNYLTRMTTIGKGVLSGDYFKGSLKFYSPLVRDFIKSIEENTVEPVPASHGLAITAVLEAAMQSIKEETEISIPEILKLQELKMK